MRGITPFLWFKGDAAEAVAFYVSLFKDGRITATTYCGPGMPQPEGTVLTISFELAGQRFVALNGGADSSFTTAVSFAVNCETQVEIDTLWERLSDGGAEIACGWLTDRFGVTWQITAAQWEEWLQAGGEPAARFMAALQGMVKLDLAALERAYRGE